MFLGVRNALDNRRLPLGSGVNVAMQNIRLLIEIYRKASSEYTYCLETWPQR
jgi:hypothetical protein